MNYTEVCGFVHQPFLTLTDLTLLQWMGLREWQVPPKWLLVEDSDDLFHLWWENHCYQETQDQHITALGTSLDSLVQEKVVLEEHIHGLELREEVM